MDSLQDYGKTNHNFVFHLVFLSLLPSLIFFQIIMKRAGTVRDAINRYKTIQEESKPAGQDFYEFQRQKWTDTDKR